MAKILCTKYELIQKVQKVILENGYSVKTAFGIGDWLENNLKTPQESFEKMKNTKEK